MGGIIMKKKSVLFEEINFIVAEQMSGVLDMVNKSRMNISQECENHFFGQSEDAEVGRKPLSLEEIFELFIIYSIISLASLTTFCAEVITQKITNKFKFCTDGKRMTKMSIDLHKRCFIKEYDEFRQQWLDVHVGEIWTEEVLGYLQSATLIDSWNDTLHSGRFAPAPVR